MFGKTTKRLFLVVLLLSWGGYMPVPAQHISPEPVLPVLVEVFYKNRKDGYIWMGADTQRAGLRMRLIQLLNERCAFQGLDKSKYLKLLPRDAFGMAAGSSGEDSSRVNDYRYTHAALEYLNDLFQGDPATRKTGDDALSRTVKEADQHYLINLLAEVSKPKDLDDLVNRLEPATSQYLLLKNALKAQLDSGNVVRIRRLSETLNNYRWMYHFHFPKFIVVNIAAAELNYYEQDSLKLNMRVVAGKPSTKTPRFAAYCDQVILYPYWNVPKSIAVNEILPFCKKNTAVLDLLRMQVLNSRGQVVNPRSINWSKITKQNFSYQFRQATGRDNALGVIKFNLTSPYSVYLHDTNLKAAFKSEKRYLSHGCVRVEKPVELADYLLEEKLDASFLNANSKGQKPVIKTVHGPVPVFILYMTADIKEGSMVQYFEDVYTLDQ
ncbi:L,D-transpeptidase family protein [Niabella drilacis]|uniref:L,D-transpeptidase family protein n=1 Tax=Niabella drilacis (strain DSM 25811 / CCM 8410 / CCUG 62505 / LMG 26954 / E90) TaxID=1285928 RepID=UPI0015A482E4|nr:L,D-transpeptidase family protein [Niabella drilacis]